MAQFTKPLSYEVISLHPEEGEPKDRATLRVLDANGKEYALTVEAQGEFERRVVEDVTLGVESEGDEPVYMIPGQEIAPAILEEVFHGLSDDLLALYLVEQQPEAPDVVV